MPTGLIRRQLYGLRDEWTEFKIVLVSSGADRMKLSAGRPGQAALVSFDPAV